MNSINNFLNRSIHTTGNLDASYSEFRPPNIVSSLWNDCRPVATAMYLSTFFLFFISLSIHSHCSPRDIYLFRSHVHVISPPVNVLTNSLPTNGSLRTAYFLQSGIPTVFQVYIKPNLFTFCIQFRLIVLCVWCFLVSTSQANCWRQSK